MSVLTKVLRAGEGKKVRRLAELVPLVNALEPEMEARSDEELQALTGGLPRSASTTARASRTCWSRRSPWSGRRPGGCSASATSTPS